MPTEVEITGPTDPGVLTVNGLVQLLAETAAAKKIRVILMMNSDGVLQLHVAAADRKDWLEPMPVEKTISLLRYLRDAEGEVTTEPQPEKADDPDAVGANVPAGDQADPAKG